jgi:hypothetical protein
MWAQREVARLNRLTAGASLKVTAATERLQRVAAAVLAKAAAAAAKAHTAAVRNSNNNSSARKPTAAEAALLARLRALQRQGKVWAIRMAEMRAYEAALAASTAAAVEAAATAAATDSSAGEDSGEVTLHSRAISSVAREEDDKSRAVSDVAADVSSGTATTAAAVSSGTTATAAAAVGTDVGTGIGSSATSTHGEQRSVFQRALDAFAASRQPRSLVAQLRQAPIVAPLGTPAPSLAAPLSSSPIKAATTTIARATAGAAAATTAGALLSGSSHHSSAKQTFASSGSQHVPLPMLPTAAAAAAAAATSVSDVLEELYWQQQQLRPSSPITQAQLLRVEGHIAVPWPQRSTSTATTAGNAASAAATTDCHISAPPQAVTISTSRQVVVKPASRALARAYCRRIRNSSAPVDDLFTATASDAAVGPAMSTDAWGAGVWPPHLKSASFSTSTTATSSTRRGASLAVPSPPTREDSGPLGGSWARSRGPSLRARAALASVFGRSPVAHSAAAAAAAVRVSEVDTVQPSGSVSSSAHGSGAGSSGGAQLPTVSDSVKIW